MNIGQKVKIKGTNSVWDGKEGILEQVDEDTCTVFVDFIPEQHKRVRQDFNIDNLDFDAYNNSSEVNDMNEDLERKLTEDEDEYDNDANTQRIIKALSEHFGVDEDEIEVSSWGGGHNFIVGDEEYWVGTYDEAYDAAVEEARMTLDEMGLEALAPDYKDYVVTKFVDTDEIESWMRESYGYYIDDIESESGSGFENRLIEEMYDAGILTDDDFHKSEYNDDPDFEWLNDDIDLDAKKEEFLNYLCDNEDAMSWLEGMYSESELGKVLEENNAIDYDGIAEDCVDTDGIAHFLASYDGEEVELVDNLFAYRRD